MANAQSLQNAANRFASVGGFSPLAVDGDVGPKTLSATLKALDYIQVVSLTGDPVPDSVGEQASAFQANAASSTSVLAANSAQVGAYLNYVADLLHLPAIYGPQIVPTANGAAAASAGLIPKLNTLATSGWAANLSNTFKALPTWQKVGIGVLGFLGIVAVSHKIKERREQAAGVSGYRYY